MRLRAAAASASLFLLATTVASAGTTITYQGQLQDGAGPHGDWFTIDSGGTTFSGGGEWTLAGPGDHSDP